MFSRALYFYMFTEANAQKSIGIFIHWENTGEILYAVTWISKLIIKISNLNFTVLTSILNRLQSLLKFRFLKF